MDGIQCTRTPTVSSICGFGRWWRWAQADTSMVFGAERLFCNPVSSLFWLEWSAHAQSARILEREPQNWCHSSRWAEATVPLSSEGVARICAESWAPPSRVVFGLRPAALAAARRPAPRVVSPRPPPTRLATAASVSCSVGQRVAQCKQRQVSVGTRPRVHNFARRAAEPRDGSLASAPPPFGPQKKCGGASRHEQLSPHCRLSLAYGCRVG